MRTQPLKFAYAISITLCGAFLSLTCAAQEPVAQTIDIGHARLVTHSWGEASSREVILALPGSGGDVTRYRFLGPLFAATGYRFVAINQRGIMGSTGSLEALTLHDLAADVIAVADALNLKQFHMMGWVFGNRTSRMLATDYPKRIASVTLIAAGGLVRAMTEPGELGRLLGEPDLKMYLARRTLFSPATHDAVVREYVQGLNYWPGAVAAQRQANDKTPLEEWAAGGTGVLLMVMGEDDLTAPIENGHLMQAEHGERLTLVTVPGAGHAIGLEKPVSTANAIIPFLRRHSY
ncbi:MAG: alpha/beta hydrolase [Proteobacteria bacterium]|nr:alpha/beta hydrolase [Pseudomonadota bacterium]